MALGAVLLPIARRASAQVGLEDVPYRPYGRRARFPRHEEMRHYEGIVANRDVKLWAR